MARKRPCAIRTGFMAKQLELLESRVVLAAPVGVEDSYRVIQGETLTTAPTNFPTLSSDFSGNTLPSFLQGAGFTVSEGTVQRTGAINHDDRAYLRTIDGNLTDKNFRFELTVNTGLSQPVDIYYVGFGKGDWRPDGAYQEPVDSLFFRNHGYTTAGGVASVANGPVRPMKDLGFIQEPGTHRLRMEKLGRKITFSMDAFYDTSFHADFTYVVDDYLQAVPTLSQGNAHLFFGSANATNRFDDFLFEPLTPNGVLANDTDADGDALTAELVSTTTHGALNLAANGSFTYVPEAGFSGVDSFQYLAKDAGSASAPTLVTINVLPPPPVPVANGDAYTVAEDGVLTVDAAVSKLQLVPFARVHDYVVSPAAGMYYVVEHTHDAQISRVVRVNPADGSASELISYNGQGLGGVAISHDGTLLYLDVGSSIRRIDTATGKETGRYDFADPRLYAEDISVFPGNRDRIVMSMAYAGISPRVQGGIMLENMHFVANTGSLQNRHDLSPDGARVVSSFTEGSSGTLSVQRFLPDNTAPTIISRDTGRFGQDVQWIGNRLLVGGGYVYDPETLNELAALPTVGGFTLDAVAGRYYSGYGNEFRVYDANTFELLHSFTVPGFDPRVADFFYNPTRFGANGLAFSASKGLYLLESDLVSGAARTRGVLANDALPQGRPWRAQVSRAPEHGSVELQANGEFKYTPSANYFGVDSFEYQITDGFTNSASGVVTITVTPTEDPPTANPDSFTGAENRPLEASVSRNLLSNDEDPDGVADLTAELVTDALHGTVTVNANGTFRYVPNTGFVGNDEFSYQVVSGSSISAPARVTINVRNVDVNVAIRAVGAASATDVVAQLPDSISSIQVGQNYFVEVWVQDATSNPSGILGGQLDIVYPSSLSRVESLSHGEALNQFTSGEVSPRQGLINDFGGGTLQPLVGAAPNWVRLGYAEIKALGDDTAVYSLQPGLLSFALFNVESVAWGRVSLPESVSVTHLANARLSYRAVLNPTTLNAGGGVAQVPSSFEFVDEWTPYWVEVYAHSGSNEHNGVTYAKTDLHYDTSLVSATEIQPGPAFAGPLFTGAINDAAGVVEGLGGPLTTLLTDGQPVLLARVRMSPTAGDQAMVDEVQHFIGPYAPALELENTSVRVEAVTEPVPTATVLDRYPEVWAVPYDIDDNDVIDYGDLSFFAAAFRQPVNGAEPPYTWWANFNRTGSVIDFADLASLSSNFGKSKASGGVLFHASYPNAWRNSSARIASAASLNSPPPSLGNVEARLVVVPVETSSDVSATVPTSVSSLVPQQSYVLEVWVNDSEASSLGVTGGELDIQFTPGKVTTGPLRHGSVYSSLVRGTVGENGKIDSFGGGTLERGRAVGTQWARIGYMPFRVERGGPIAIEASLGDLQFSRYSAGNVPNSNVVLKSALFGLAPGDTDQDADVDIVDFYNVRKNFGTGKLRTQGDLDGNGTVNIADFALLRANFGRRAALETPPPPLTANASDVMVQGAALAAYMTTAKPEDKASNHLFD